MHVFCKLPSFSLTKAISLMTTPKLQQLIPNSQTSPLGKPLQHFPPDDGALRDGCLFPGESRIPKGEQHPACPDSHLP